MHCINLRQESPFNGVFAPRYEQPGYAPANNYMHVPNSSVAREFADNFHHFRGFGKDFVSRQNLELAAERPMTGDRYTDRMTLLAREILSRPEMSHMLDAINNGGREDGLISPGDVDATIEHFDAQETPPQREAPRYYGGGLQQQRFGGQFDPRFTPQFAPRFTPQGAPQFAPQGAWQQPAYGGQYVNENQWNGPAQASGHRSYANDSKEAFCNKILARFSTFEDPNSPGLITDRSLSAIASGYRLDGQPATQAEIDLANEMLERGSLFKELDQSGMGVLDGAFSRNDLAIASNKYSNMSDHDLLQGVKDNFRQFTAGANDKYVNVNELKEAAGLIPSNRTFSQEARQLAAELLKRPGLLRDLDIGIKVESGKPGAEDQRFDIDNLNHMLGKS